MACLTSTLDEKGRHTQTPSEQFERKPRNLVTSLLSVAVPTLPKCVGALRGPSQAQHGPRWLEWRLWRGCDARAPAELPSAAPPSSAPDLAAILGPCYSSTSGGDTLLVAAACF